MGGFATFPFDGTREEQEAWVVALVMRGRRTNAVEIARKLMAVQGMESPECICCFRKPTTQEVDNVDQG